jgi:hypothetical protein
MAETQNLYGSDLDIAVALAEVARGVHSVRVSDGDSPVIVADGGGWEPFRPSISWAHAGAVIDANQICIVCDANGQWVACLQRTPERLSRGPTALIAAMRAYVASQA